MRSRLHQIVVPVIVLAAVVSAAGCGGSSNSPTTSTTSTTTSTTTTTSAAATTTTGTSGTTTSASAAASAALGALASAGNCKSLAGLGEAYSQALSGSGTVDVGQGGGAAAAVRPEGPGGNQAGLRDLRQRPHEGRLGDRLLQARHDAEPVGAREARLARDLDQYDPAAGGRQADPGLGGRKLQALLTVAPRALPGPARSKRAGPRSLSSRATGGSSRGRASRGSAGGSPRPARTPARPRSA